MGSEWKTAKLTDHYEIRSGLSKPAKDFGSGYPFLTFKDVFYNYFTPEKLGDLVESTEKDRLGCSVLRGDVFLTRTSETMNELGMSCVALKDYENSTFNGFCKRLRPKADSELVPEYVGYYLRSPLFRRSMMAFSTMSTRASLNNEMISRLDISYPDPDEQVEIARVLKTLDEKISLNNQINQTLEQMAQTLFKSWFVDFDPVIDNVLDAGSDIPEVFETRVERRKAVRESADFKPLPDDVRQLFPSEFEESELGWVPKGWGIDSIYSCADLIYGAPFKSKQFNEDSLGLPVIRIRDLKTGKPQYFTEENHPKKTLVRTGDILVGMDAEFRATIWPGSQGYLNQRLFYLKPKGENISNLFLKYTIQPLLDLEERAQVGTTVAHLGKKDIDKFRILVPTTNILGVSKVHFSELLSRIVEIYCENTALGKLRDTLLPKLISGELRLDSPEVEQAKALVN
tara:strand:+ start:6268 stop:7638 length:1371 start_codon:yes stop_codon:yes gene_type:complete